MHRSLREAGSSHYSLGNLVSLALNGIVSFSASRCALASLLGVGLVRDGHGSDGLYLFLGLAYEFTRKSARLHHDS